MSKKKKEVKKPTPEQFGWQGKVGFDDSEGGWVYEGGEEKYFEALREWETKMSK